MNIPKYLVALTLGASISSTVFADAQVYFVNISGISNPLYLLDGNGATIKKCNLGSGLSAAVNLSSSDLSKVRSVHFGSIPCGTFPTGLPVSSSSFQASSSPFACSFASPAQIPTSYVINGPSGNPTTFPIKNGSCGN
jgi:hypothetical protein